MSPVKQTIREAFVNLYQSKWLSKIDTTGRFLISLLSAGTGNARGSMRLINYSSCHIAASHQGRRCFSVHTGGWLLLFKEHKSSAKGSCTDLHPLSTQGWAGGPRTGSLPRQVISQQLQQPVQQDTSSCAGDLFSHCTKTSLLQQDGDLSLLHSSSATYVAVCTASFPMS